MHGCMDAGTYGCMDTDAWSCGVTGGHRDALMHGCMETWVQGCMDAFLPGHLGMWMHKRWDAWTVRHMLVHGQRGGCSKTQPREAWTDRCWDAGTDGHRDVWIHRHRDTQTQGHTDMDTWSCSSSRPCVQSCGAQGQTWPFPLLPLFPGTHPDLARHPLALPGPVSPGCPLCQGSTPGWGN